MFRLFFFFFQLTWWMFRYMIFSSMFIIKRKALDYVCSSFSVKWLNYNILYKMNYIFNVNLKCQFITILICKKWHFNRWVFVLEHQERQERSLHHRLQRIKCQSFLFMRYHQSFANLYNTLNGMVLYTNILWCLFSISTFRNNTPN